MKSLINIFQINLNKIAGIHDHFVLVYSCILDFELKWKNHASEEFCIKPTTADHFEILDVNFKLSVVSNDNQTTQVNRLAW